MKYIALFFSLALVGLDQLFKKLAVDYLSNVVTFPVIKDIFHLTYLENRGAAFGILDGKSLFLIIVTIIIIIVLIVLILSNKFHSKFLLWSLSLAIGGGIGNLIDRIFRGYVIDYLEFPIIQFAVFNFADCCVVVGTILIMIYILFLDRNQSLNQNKIAKSIGDEDNKINNE